MIRNTDGMSETYYLSNALLDGDRFELNKDQYEAINRALSISGLALELEELFQVFAQSFIGFERDLMDLSLQWAFPRVRDQNFKDFFRTVRHRVNVSIITILTAYRSYDDQCNRILKSSSIAQKAYEFNCSTRREIYDSHLSYRICACLRNYAQHHSLPLSGFSVGGDSDFEYNSAGKIERVDTAFVISLYLNVATLKSSSSCGVPLRNELSNLGYEKIDMIWLIRCFTGAMYERHSALRSFLKPDVQDALKEITSAYEIVNDFKPGKAKFLKLHGDGRKRSMRIDLASDVLDYFNTFRSLKEARRSYVSSRIRTKDTICSGQ